MAALLTVAFLSIANVSSLWAGRDSDGDGRTDEYDNCPFNANAHQEDANQDGIGDKCDPVVHNYAFEPGGSGFFSASPEYRAKISVTNILFDQHGNRPDIGLFSDLDGETLQLSPSSLKMGSVSLAVNNSATLSEGSGGSVEAPGILSGALTVDGHFSGTSAGIILEFSLREPSAIPVGSVEMKFNLKLPQGFTIDTSSLVEGRGNLIVKNSGGQAVYVIETPKLSDPDDPAVIEVGQWAISGQTLTISFHETAMTLKKIKLRTGVTRQFFF